MKTKVLQVNHFFIFPENSGGHKRVAAVNAAIKNAGFDTLFLSIGPSYPNLRKSGYIHINLDVALSDSRFGWYSLENTLMDYFDTALFEKVSRIVKSFGPEIVIFEHPWWYPFFKAVFIKLGISPKIVYSSLNVESDLKRGILSKMSIATDYIEDQCSKINAVEEELCQISEFVICVTSHDAQWFRDLGAKKVIVAENRIRMAEPLDSDVERFREIAKHTPYMIFVGSAHPPNVTGMKDVLGVNWGFVPPDARILLMGGVANAFLHDPFFKEFWTTNYSRSLLIPDCSDSEIAAALMNAVAVILPVMDGGGSNLKTIEALLSGRRIIATSKSFAGHENYINDPLVTIASSSAEFRKIIRESILMEPVSINRDSDFFRELSWERQMDPVVDWLKRMH